MNSPRKIIMTFFGVMLFVGIGVFTYSRIQQYIQGPFLADVSIISPLFVDEPVLPVSGTIQNTNIVMLNGKILGVSEEGIFNGTIVLVPGSNIIEIQLGDSFGKQRTYTYEVYLNSKVPYVPLLQQAQEQYSDPEPIEDTDVIEEESE